MIFVMSGKKQSGKSTACYHMFNRFQERREELGICSQWCKIDNEGNILAPTSKFDGYNIDVHKPYLEEFFKKSGCKIYNFADSLKQKICIEILNLDPMCIYGSNKQKSKPTHIYWDSMPKEIQQDFRRSDLKMEKRQPMTHRQVMEVVGTGIFRSMDPNCWSQATYNLIESEDYPLALITDARFPNEVSMASERNGYCIRLLRDPFPDEKKPKPETALDDFPLGNFSYIVDNNKMELDEKNRSLDKIFNDKITRFQ